MRQFIFFFIFLLNLSVNAQEYIQVRRFIVPSNFSAQSVTSSLSRSSIQAASSGGNFYASYDIDLGSTPVGTQLQTTIDYFSHPQTTTQTIYSVVITGSPDFFISNDGCLNVDIGGGQHCYIDVVFRPTIEGPQTAQVAVRFTGVFRQLDGRLDNIVGLSEFNYTASSYPVELTELDTDNTCSVAANSSINMTSLSLNEVISLSGLDFSLNYESNRLRSNSKYNPILLGLGGWNLSNVHYYDPAGAIVYFGDGSVRNVVASVQSGKYVVSSKDGDQIFEFDPNGKHILTKDAKTNVTLRQIEYDSSGRFLRQIDQFGKISSAVYNSTGVNLRSHYGLITKLVFDSSGYLASVENPINAVYSMINNSTGLLLKFKKPMGQESTVTYDNDGRVILDQGAGGDLVQVDRQYYSNLNAQLTIKKSALNIPMAYDSSGDASSSRLIYYGSWGESSTSIFTQQGTNTYSNNYGESSQSVQAQDPRFDWMSPFVSNYNFNVSNSPIAIQKSTNRVVENYTPGSYGSFTKLIETEQEQNDPNRIYTKTFLANKKTEVFKTPRGRFTKQIFNDKNRISSLEVRGLTPIDFQYDNLGKLTQINQGVRTSSRSYDRFGFLSSITDFDGKTTLYNHDRAGRLVKKTLPDGRAINFGYDQNGNLTKIKPPGKKDHLFNYDLMDLVSDYLPPSLTGIQDTSTRYVYNLDRQISQIQKPSGDTISYNYSPFSGFLETINTPSGQYRYTFPNFTKLLSQVTSPDSIDLNYSYYGSFLRKVQTQGSIQNELEYLYSPDARISGLIVSDGTNSKQIDFKYDRDGVLIRAGQMGMRRGNFREVTLTKIGNITGDHTYNSFGESLTDSYFALTQALFNRSYTRDNVGRITNVSENGQQTNSKNIQYIYDLQGRLTNVIQNGQTIRSYMYDANGNRLQKKSGSTIVNARFDAQDRLIKLGKISYEYNANGDLAKSIDGTKITSYQFDVFGNLKSVTLPNQSQINYIIDGQNRRIGKKINNQLVQSFIYQSQTQIAAEMDGQNRIVKRFIYGEKSNIPDYMIFQNKNYRIISDQVGTPRMLVEVSTGQISAQYDYDEFGVLLSKTGSIEIPFGFAGGIKDDDTGLVRFGARDYSPAMGRWTAKDPILFNGGDANLYGYVLNDPVNYVDRDGKAAVLAAVLVIGAVATAAGVVYEYITNPLFKIDVDTYIDNLINGPPPPKTPAPGTDTPLDLPDYKKRPRKPVERCV